MAAGYATKDRLALAILRGDVPAAMAGLGSEGCPDLFNSSGRLLLKALDQPSPAASEDPAVQAGFAADTGAWSVSGAARGSGHSPDANVFHAYEIEGSDERGTSLLDPVAPTVDLAGDLSGYRVPDPLAALRASDGAGQASLESGQSATFSRGGFRCMHKVAGGKRDRHRYTTIDTDGTAIVWRWNRRGHRSECDMPPSSWVAGDSVGFRGRWRPAPSELDPTDLGDSHGPDPFAEASDVLGPHGDDAETIITTRFSPGRSPEPACEVVGHCLAEVPKRLLLHHLRTTTQPARRDSRCRQLSCVLEVGRRRPAAWAPEAVLLDREIPDESCLPAELAELFCLRWGWQETKPGHGKTLTQATDSFDRVLPDGVSLKGQFSNRNPGVA